MQKQILPLNLLIYLRRRYHVAIHLAMLVLTVGCYNASGPDQHTRTSNKNANGWISNYPVDSIDLISFTNFEFYGIVHNECLDHIYSNLIADLSTMSMSETQFDSALYQNVVYYHNQVNTTTSGHSFSPIAFTPGGSAGYPGNMIDTINGLTDFMRTVCKRIDSTLLCATSYTSAATEFSLIQHMIDTSTSTASDRPFLYACLAIARYSAAYWSGVKGSSWLNKINETGSAWYGNDYVPQAAIDWGRVAEADFAGFVAGVARSVASGAWIQAGARGAIIGGLSTGGVGAVAGAIVGALGSVAASGAANAAVTSGGALAWQLLFE